MYCLAKKVFTSICPHNMARKYCTFTDGGQKEVLRDMVSCRGWTAGWAGTRPTNPVASCLPGVSLSCDSVPLKLSKELSALKKQNLKILPLDRDSICLFGGPGEPLDYLQRAQNSFERKQSIKVQKVNQRSIKRDSDQFFLWPQDWHTHCSYFIYFWGRRAGLQWWPPQRVPWQGFWEWGP